MKTAAEYKLLLFYVLAVAMSIGNKCVLLCDLFYVQPVKITIDCNLLWDLFYVQAMKALNKCNLFCGLFYVLPMKTANECNMLYELLVQTKYRE